MSESAIALYDDSRELSTVRPPEQVLAEAREAALALTKVISLKKKPVMFNGEQYLEFEDWQTCAKFYGCTVKIVSTNYVEYGQVHGFEAVAVVLDRNQNEISRAESLCLDDEENWGMVAEYEWKDKLDSEGKKVWDAKGGKNGKGSYEREKVKVGEKAKPLFQLKSMAQTRAGARALRQVFAWVVVLAGYKPSVAEEMTGNEQPRQDADPQDEGSTSNGKKAAVTQPQRSSEVVQEEISGTISGARLASSGALWCQVDSKVLAIAEPKVTDEMVNGALITVTAKKMKNEAMGEYWGVNNVIKCEVVAEGDVTEEENQEPQHDASAEEPTKAQPEPTKAQEAKTAVAESLKDVFEGGTVKTAREVADETAAKKDKAWRSHVGHDPAKHINYKQGMLLFAICGKNGLNIPDATVKELLTDVFKADGHRYLITQDDFPKVLDTLDPEFKHHERK